MKSHRTFLFTPVVFSALFFCVSAMTALGQQPENGKSESAAAIKTVKARQDGEWTVGIDSAKNVVRLANSPDDPLPVKIIKNGSPRKPFQVRLRTVINVGESRNSESIGIPAGKRFVIENVNAFNNRPSGLQISMQLLANMDSNGDGQMTIDELGIFHIPLTDQITFSGSGSTESSGNHKVLIFADERIGNGTQTITLFIALNGTATRVTQGVVTLSGYLEDLPSNP